MLKGKNKTQKDNLTFVTQYRLSVSKATSFTRKMAFNSKSTPTSPNLQRTTYHFVQKRKILKRSACESKTLKGSFHVFTQEGNQCGLSLLAFLSLF